jgi:hypothetical protein
MTETHTATAWGIEYANGGREWYDDKDVRDEAYSRDARLAVQYPDEDPAPVARLTRTVVTHLTVTREAAPNVPVREVKVGGRVTFAFRPVRGGVWCDDQDNTSGDLVALLYLHRLTPSVEEYAALVALATGGGR